MKSSPKLRPNRFDALVVLAVLSLALALGMFTRPPSAQSGALHVVVCIDGEEMERTPLTAYPAEARYSNNGYTLVVHVQDGALSVFESNCPGQDCVLSGAISRAGQSIVCLPARITIQLVGSPAGYDLVTG